MKQEDGQDFQASLGYRVIFVSKIITVMNNLNIYVKIKILAKLSKRKNDMVLLPSSLNALSVDVALKLQHLFCIAFLICVT